MSLAYLGKGFRAQSQNRAETHNTAGVRVLLGGKKRRGEKRRGGRCCGRREGEGSGGEKRRGEKRRRGRCCGRREGEGSGEEKRLWPVTVVANEGQALQPPPPSSLPLLTQ